MYLDTVTPMRAHVGYGQLGTGGNLGYERKQVMVQGRAYAHALSTHPPARVVFPLRGGFRAFSCQVALNDDVQAGVSHADFTLIVDGRPVAAASHVAAGAAPVALQANVAGAQMLELAVTTSRWECCHAVWLDPMLDEQPLGTSAATQLSDCLARAFIDIPSSPLEARRCIGTVVSPGFEGFADDMLGSLYANGACGNALVVVFALNPSAACERVVEKYRATLIRCRAQAPINPMSKAVLYSIARVVNAEEFICLDADMLVLRELTPIFSMLEACPPGSILACREGNGRGLRDLGHALQAVYRGADGDLPHMLGKLNGEHQYPFVVNDGLFAGKRDALLALDGAIREMPRAATWVDQRRDVWWRNQFVFNLALARLGCGVELDDTNNVQLHVQDVELHRDGVHLEAIWHGRPVRVLHFSGAAKRKYPEARGLFARVADPVAGRCVDDAYGAFLSVLRQWVGRHGSAALAWSFYGTTDGEGARVNDASTWPLLALLHYLIRANGCVRVLETGTARGISAACLASAVVHRDGGRVVTFDPYAHPERAELWAALPESMRACIDERQVGSLEGMAAAVAAGERYEAALLDSIHSEEHVWAEFALAAQLVCPGGLILIHDARYVHGTVEGALRRIEREGYSVVRLWTAETGIAEDDQLGLAIVENRRRPTAEAATP